MSPASECSTSGPDHIESFAFLVAFSSRSLPDSEPCRTFSDSDATLCEKSSRQVTSTPGSSSVPPPVCQVWLIPSPSPASNERRLPPCLNDPGATQGGQESRRGAFQVGDSPSARWDRPCRLY